ncbi:hypothetical protein MN116_007958 [Schistosoma mekongi]|uniref:Uncharacterized protein n=1 Tax=Schistosoma mekongi TaxID=38744 RepID=A0AAE1Z8H2_SCHME|nr:hypothetical protein MN116_007958 [Schistosoma mekongi]
MNPNYPNSFIGYGWQVDQNVAPSLRYEQPQIGFCFDSPNLQVPQVHPLQNPEVLGSAYGQTVTNPSLPYSIPVGNSQPNTSTDSIFKVKPSRPSAPPFIRSVSPKLNRSYPDKSVTPSAPSEPISTTHGESTKVITITRQDSHKTDTISTHNNNNQNNRRDSYQDSLKDMAALMTDVELTDDVINSMRQRFDLQQ